jgi:ATP-dependent DNA helicase DinG
MVGDAATKAVSALRTLIEGRPGGEHRPQQEALAASVADALETGKDLLVQAGTGTGKSLGYLVPVALSGKRVVVSTATKQLGDQLARSDLPTVEHLLPRGAGPEPSYAIVKGRRSYLCRARISELKPAPAAAERTPEPVADELALFDAPFAPPPPSRHPTDPVGRASATPLDRLIAWAEQSTTGDRTDAPAGTTEVVWREVSVDSSGCPGAHRCAFGPTCFSEAARRAARTADIVITNHALVAQDLRSSTPIFGDWDALVLDEGHEVEGVLTEAWAAQVRPAALHAAVALAARRFAQTPEGLPPPADGLLGDLDALTVEMQQLRPGELQTLPAVLRALLEAIAAKLLSLGTELESAARGLVDDESTSARGSVQLLRESRDAIATLLSDDSSRARWLERARADTGPGELRSAPLWVGPDLRRLRGERTLIATSATLTVGGSFAPFARALGLSGEDWTGLDVGTPFDYRRQAALYIPNPARFPAPVGRDRAEHTAAVLVELTSLVRAAGGRTLALFTTTNAARQAAEHLRHAVTTPVLCQGEAPVGQLIARFGKDDATTLCATMGLWHGVDVPGPSLTCLVLDKIPFAPLDAPVAAARRRSADEAGRDGFAEVYVADAAVKITQGVGRLIRTTTDRGVVAVLDPRLLTKGYGRTILGSLPSLHRTSDLEAVLAMISRIV